jgi:hypothetical protein
MDKPWKVIAAFIGVFVAGAVFGGFFALGMGSKLLTPATTAAPAVAPVVTTNPAVTPPTPLPATAPVPAPVAAAKGVANAQRIPRLQVPPYMQTPQMMRQYAEKLDLTAQQKENISPRIQRAAEDFRRLWQGYVRETSIIVQRLQEDIRKELTPEQVAKLEKWEQRQQELLEKNEQKLREQKKGGAGKAGKANQKAGVQPAPTSTSAPTPTEPSSTATTAPSTSAEKKE